MAMMALSLIFAGGSLMVYLLFWLVSPERAQGYVVIGTVAAVGTTGVCVRQVLMVTKALGLGQGEDRQVVPVSWPSLGLGALGLVVILFALSFTIVSLRAQPDVPLTERLSFPGLGASLTGVSVALFIVAGNLAGAWKGRAAAGS